MSTAASTIPITTTAGWASPRPPTGSARTRVGRGRVGDEVARHEVGQHRPGRDEGEDDGRGLDERTSRPSQSARPLQRPVTMASSGSRTRRLARGGPGRAVGTGCVVHVLIITTVRVATIRDAPDRVPEAAGGCWAIMAG